jgi:hypothetical protein
MVKIMSPDLRILVEVLAGQDAVWRPLRKIDWDSTGTPAALYRARCAYPSEGAPWQSDSAEEAARKRDLRRLERLADAELVEVFRPAARSIGARLTDAGESVARAVADLPGLDDAHEWMRRLLRYGLDASVNECILYSGDPTANYPPDIEEADLAFLQTALLPALSRGFLVASSDIAGRVYYSIEPEGIAWGRGPAPEMPDGLPECDDELADFYVALTRQRRAEYRRELKRDGELGFIPLPVSGGTIR